MYIIVPLHTWVNEHEFVKSLPLGWFENANKKVGRSAPPRRALQKQRREFVDKRRGFCGKILPLTLIAARGGEGTLPRRC